MLPYRSELLMTASPNNCHGSTRKEATSNATSGNTSTTASSATGQPAAQKTAALESVAARQSKHGISEVSSEEKQGTKQVLLTLNQKKLAGIAQSKVMIEHREQSQISDRIIAMNKKRVAGKKLIINEHKFLISHLPPDNLQRRLDMQELRIMDQD